MHTSVDARQGDLAARYVWLLAATNMFAYADRAMSALFAPQLKVAFALSDAQLGALQGAPFVISYVLASAWAGSALQARIRPGRYLAGCVLLWTLGSTVFALAPAYEGLWLARAGLGLGQAAFMPAALTLLARRRGRVLGGQPIAVFTTGSSIGRSVGLLAGSGLAVLFGAVAALAPWRVACLALVAPNLVLAGLILAWSPPGEARSSGPVDGLAGAWSWAWSRGPGLALYMIAACAVIVITQSCAAWAPSIIGRAFALSPVNAGVLVGLVTLVAAPAGHLAAGRVAHRLDAFRSGPGRLLCAGAGVAAAAAVGLVGAGSAGAALVLLALVVAAGGFAAAIALIGFQGLTPHAHRRSANAAYFALATTFGTAAGPLITGWVSDLVAADGRRLPLALALVVAAAAGVVGLCAALAKGRWNASLDTTKG